MEHCFSTDPSPETLSGVYAMIRCTAWLLVVLLAPAAMAADYAVVVSKATRADAAWKPVVDALVAKHAAAVVEYETDIQEARAKLSDLHPRYTCFVAKPGDAGRPFVADVNRLTCAYDDDPYTDTFWGILTGYDAAGAMAIATHAEPLTVRNVAAGTEVALEMCEQGLWYDELVKGKTVSKKPGREPRQDKGPDNTTHALAEALGAADLFVTSGHATERDWQIGYRYRNGSFKSEGGKMFGVTAAGERFAIRSDRPKVYLPVGNCLMGHVNGPDAMALAWMNSCGVRQMAGYTVPTWYGYAGWGLLDTFVEQPGRYTLAEAFRANQLALEHRLVAAAPQAAEQHPPPGARASIKGEITAEGQALGVTAGDVAGLLHDRDVVAFYGDPKWEARMATGPGIRPAYGQELTEKDGVYTLTITPSRGADSFKPVNTNGSQRGWRPIVAFLPRRVKDVEVLAGEDLKPLIADDFILVPNPRTCDPSRRHEVRFRARPMDGP